MKTITKAKRFIERMEGVESLNERQLVELLFRANEIITDYVATEDKKEAAYLRLKAETNYRAKSVKKTVEAISKPKNVAVLPVNTIETIAVETTNTVVEETTVENITVTKNTTL